MRPLYAPEAKRDLVGIGLFIARDNPRRAISFVLELKAQCRKIAQAPTAYRSRTELGTHLRSCAHGNYTIFFTASAAQVTIVRILHGAMEMETQFAEASTDASTKTR